MIHNFWDELHSTGRLRQSLYHLRMKLRGAIESTVDSYEEFQQARNEQDDDMQSNVNHTFEFMDGAGDEPFLTITTEVARATLWFDKPWNTVSCTIGRFSAFPIKEERSFVTAREVDGIVSLRLISAEADEPMNVEMFAAHVVRSITLKQLSSKDFIVYRSFIPLTSNDLLFL